MNVFEPTVSGGGPRTPAASAIRTLVAERSAQLRQRVSDVFRQAPGFALIGESAVPEELAEICADYAPDIVVLGLGGRGDHEYALSALAALQWAIRTAPTVGAIVLVNDDTLNDVLEPLRAGARAVLLRDAPDEALTQAAANIVTGYASLDPRLAGAVFEYIARAERAAGGGATAIDPAVRRTLSPREQEVLQELARGLHNDDIAARLGVSVGTVKTHLRHIYRKLDVNDRVSAVLAAFRLRLPEAA